MKGSFIHSTHVNFTRTRSSKSLVSSLTPSSPSYPQNLRVLVTTTGAGAVISGQIGKHLWGLWGEIKSLYWKKYNNWCGCSYFWSDGGAQCWGAASKIARSQSLCVFLCTCLCVCTATATNVCFGGYWGGLPRRTPFGGPHHMNFSVAFVLKTHEWQAQNFRENTIT